ncbi:hypothetical protein AB3S75_044988 [Citrus x aurantiifolia]
MGHAVVQKAQIPFGKSLEESQKLLNQTSAALAMMQSQPLDLSTIENIAGILNSAVSGQLLSLSEICAVQRTLRASHSAFGRVVRAAALQLGEQQFEPSQCIVGVSLSQVNLSEGSLLPYPSVRSRHPSNI